MENGKVLISSIYKEVTLHLPNGGIIEFKDNIAYVPREWVEWILNRPAYQAGVNYKIEKAQNILVIRNMGLGDTLMITPIFKEFKRRYKDKKLTFATYKRYMPLFENNPYIDKLIPLNSTTDYNSYEVVVNLNMYVEENKFRETINRIDLFCVPFEFDLPIHKIDLFFPKDYDKKFLNRFKISNNKKIGIEFRASSGQRSFNSKMIKDVSLILAEKGYDVYVLDQEFISWPDHENVINFSGKFNILETCYIVSKLDLLICPDSGLLHVANAFNVDTIACFLTIDPKLRVSKYLNKIYTIIPDKICFPCDDRLNGLCNGGGCSDSIKENNILDKFSEWELEKQFGNKVI